MTVYAIVNGLSPRCAAAEDDAPIWSIVSPAGILQGGNPYFVPDFADSFEARTAIAIRIGRLGKGIARRFAHRYVESVAPAVLFVADSMLYDLSSKGLPWSRAISYDRCLALGQFSVVPFEDVPARQVGLRLLGKDGMPIEESFRGFLDLDIASVIERLSRDNTLKTGDIILAGIASSGPKAQPGLSAILSLDGAGSLRFNIR